jgi:hypothetical protein
MKTNPYTCIKCGNSMVRGFAADHGERHFFKLAWIDGEPEHAKLFGITGENIDIAWATRRTVRGLRCVTCCYLELYAV